MIIIIIIYNAQSDLKESFVCVEIGNDENSYSYLKIDKNTQSRIYNQLCKDAPQNLKEKTRNKKVDNQAKSPKKALIFNWIDAGYSLIALGLSVFQFQKINSIESALKVFVPTLVIIIVTYTLLNLLDNITARLTDAIKRYKQNEAEYTKIISSDQFVKELESAIRDLEQELLDRMRFGDAKKILGINNYYREVWILTNLSRELKSPDFKEWLESLLTTNTNVKLHLLYPDGMLSKGRESIVNALLHKFPNRVFNKSINENRHYIWANTYGVLYFISDEDEDLVFISLGSDGNVVFKKVDSEIISEEGMATIIGKLRILSGNSKEVQHQ